MDLVAEMRPSKIHVSPVFCLYRYVSLRWYVRTYNFTRIYNTSMLGLFSGYIMFQMYNSIFYQVLSVGADADGDSRSL